MPNIKSAKKRVLIGKARNLRNRSRRSDMKTAMKKFEAAAAEGNRAGFAGKSQILRNNAGFSGKSKGGN